MNTVISAIIIIILLSWLERRPDTSDVAAILLPPKKKPPIFDILSSLDMWNTLPSLTKIRLLTVQQEGADGSTSVY